MAQYIFPMKLVCQRGLDKKITPIGAAAQYLQLIKNAPFCLPIMTHFLTQILAYWRAPAGVLYFSHKLEPIQTNILKFYANRRSGAISIACQIWKEITHGLAHFVTQILAHWPAPAGVIYFFLKVYIIKKTRCKHQAD